MSRRLRYVAVGGVLLSALAILSAIYIFRAERKLAEKPAPGLEVAAPRPTEEVARVNPPGRAQMNEQRETQGVDLPKPGMSPPRVKPPAATQRRMERDLKLERQPSHPVRREPSPKDIAAAISRQLVEGRVLYEPSHEMVLRKPSTVLVRLSADPSSDIAQDLKRGGYIIEKADVAYRMKAVLDAPDGAASIRPLGGLPDGMQLISQQGYSPWMWSVTPMQREDFDLTLYIYAVLRLDNETAPRLVLTKQAKIRVRPSPLLPSVLSEAGSFALKVYGRLPEIAASGIVSGVVALYYWRRRRREQPSRIIITGVGA